MSTPDFEKRDIGSGSYGPSSTPGAGRYVGGDATPGGGLGTRGWALGAHLSGPAIGLLSGGSLGFLVFLGPLVVMLVQGPKDAEVRAHAVEALNFAISFTIYFIVASILVLLLVGFILLPIIAVAYLILGILGAVAANDGRVYRYPLTMRFVS